MRIVVAMSGGVDSSTAAALLVEQGHEVIGLSMKTHETEWQSCHNRACCTPEDMRDARTVADRLKIPFYLLNYTDNFFEEVIKPFAQAYAAGQTPNPCVVCNDKIKFRPMLARAKSLGADYLATGHYARIVQPNDGCEGQEVNEGSKHGDNDFILQRGVDQQKDQSYFLYRLNSKQLANIMFPLGGMTKTEVRAHARRLGIATADKAESQEICFVGPEGYGAVVERVLGYKPKTGSIVDGDGKALAEHEGIHLYTIGQRKGLQITTAKPVYVNKIDAVTGNVVVGTREEAMTRHVWVEQITWIGAAPHVGDKVWVQQRYKQNPQPATIMTQEDQRLELLLDNPEQRGAPGQAAVVYGALNTLNTLNTGIDVAEESSRTGDMVLGGGVIVDISLASSAIPAVGSATEKVLNC